MTFARFADRYAEGEGYAVETVAAAGMFHSDSGLVPFRERRNGGKASEAKQEGRDEPHDNFGEQQSLCRA
jgi:hypothetical protein